MIENRYRLEKQIFLGRQSVRKALHSRSNDRATAKVESMPQEPVPQPITGTKLPSISVPPMSNAVPTEEPLPMDTDAEALMLNGEGERQTSPSPPQRHSSEHGLLEPGPSRLQSRRRYSRTSIGSHREPIHGGDYGGATPDPPPHSADEDHIPIHHEKQNSNTLHSGILRRLSKSSLRAAFNSLRRPTPTPSAPSKRSSVDYAQTWSEDSSTDDDDLSILSKRRNSRYPSAFELQTALQRQLSTDEDDAGQVDQDS